MTTRDAVEVTQADREAAADFIQAIPPWRHQSQPMRDGHCDTSATVQAFAHHRMNATSDEIERLRTQLAEARGAVDQFARCAYPVSAEINERGYNWSEAYLDEALSHYRTLAGESPKQETTNGPIP